MKIDGFEASRAPASIDAAGKAVHGYRTLNLAGIFVRERGLFKKHDQIEYLKSL